MKDKYVVYPAVFLPETEPGYEGYYNVVFPDIPAADTYGRNLKEATYSAWESLGLNLFDQEKLPQSATWQEVAKQYPNEIVQYISVDLVEYAKGVKRVTEKVTKNTRIPKDLAQEAESLGLNFSAILTKALYQEIKEIKDLK